MKSKTSYFNFNKNIFMEDLKRLWVIPALYTLVLFLTSISPILMVYNTLTENGYYLVNRLLTNDTFFSYLFITTAPLAVAVLIFRYLQQTNSAAVMHAFPFTRKELFTTHCICGIILTVLPVIITGGILLLIKKPVYNHAEISVDIFTVAAILKWAGQTLLMTLSGFSIAVFAGIITGSTLLHTIFGFGFLFLLPALGALVLIYLDEFIFGFSSNWMINQFVVGLSPITSRLDGNDFSSGNIAWYIILTVILLTVSYILYLHRKLERSTDSIAFNFLKPLFKYSVAFCGMTILGMYLMKSGDNKMFGMYVGFVIGSLVAYIIAEMIVEKTIWVFRNLKGYFIYLIIAALFVVLIQTDILGYEGRLPSLDKVEGIYYGNLPIEKKEWDNLHMLSDDYNIESSYEFHQSIIDNKKWLENDHEDQTYYITLNYFLENGKIFTRQYILPYEFFEHNPYIKKVYESDEYIKATNSIFDVEEKNLKAISLYSYLSDKTIQIIDPLEINELCQALKEDLLNENFSEMLSRQAPKARVDFFWKENNILQDKYYHAPLLKKSYKNTLNWLEVKGYIDYISVYPDEVQYIAIQKQDKNEYFTDRSTVGGPNSLIVPEASSDLMVITDEETIQKVLDTYENRFHHAHKGYMLSIVFKNDRTDTGFYRSDSAPQFIVDYFR